MKNILALILAVGAATAANAALVYDNIPATGSYFTGGVRPNFIADDFDFAPVGSNLPTLVTGINLGFNTSAATNLDIVIRFYSDLDFTAAAGTNIFAPNTNPVASILIPGFNIAAAGSYVTGMLNLGSLSFTMPAISNYATSNHGISVEFLNAGTQVRNTATTILFNGTAPLVGDSADRYYRDADNNGIFNGSDARSFGGGTAIANFALQLDSTPVPEPATLLILAAGIPALLRRRNKN